MGYCAISGVWRAIDLVMSWGAEFISIDCTRGGISFRCSVAGIWGVMDLVVDSGAESTSMGCGGGNSLLFCSISAIDQGEERRDSEAERRLCMTFPGGVIGTTGLCWQASFNSVEGATGYQCIHCVAMLGSWRD